MLRSERKNRLHRPREFRWYTRGIQNGRVVILGGFITEDEAVEAGLKCGGYYETKLLPTVDLAEASRAFRYDLFRESSQDEMPNVFKRFSHKLDGGN